MDDSKKMRHGEQQLINAVDYCHSSVSQRSKVYINLRPEILKFVPPTIVVDTSPIVPSPRLRVSIRLCFFQNSHDSTPANDHDINRLSVLNVPADDHDIIDTISSSKGTQRNASPMLRNSVVKHFHKVCLQHIRNGRL
nr:hypothetical protein [Tanacetum cinerariifolium]